MAFNLQRGRNGLGVLGELLIHGEMVMNTSEGPGSLEDVSLI